MEIRKLGRRILTNNYKQSGNGVIKRNKKNLTTLKVSPRPHKCIVGII